MALCKLSRGIWQNKRSRNTANFKFCPLNYLACRSQRECLCGIVIACRSRRSRSGDIRTDSVDFTGKMMLMEEVKTLPFGDVWEEYCARQGVPEDKAWYDEVMDYERKVLVNR